VRVIFYIKENWVIIFSMICKKIGLDHEFCFELWDFYTSTKVLTWFNNNNNNNNKDLFKNTGESVFLKNLKNIFY